MNGIDREQENAPEVGRWHDAERRTMHDFAMCSFIINNMPLKIATDAYTHSSRHTYTHRPYLPESFDTLPNRSIAKGISKRGNRILPRLRKGNTYYLIYHLLHSLLGQVIPFF